MDSEDIQCILSGNMFSGSKPSKENRRGGVVSYFDMMLTSSEQVDSFVVGKTDTEDYICFGLRIDEPKITAAVSRSHLNQICSDWLEQNPGFRKIPKEVREALVGASLSELRKKIPPTPTIYRCVWDLNAGEILLDGKTSMVDSFRSIIRELFGATINVKPFFHGLNLEPEVKNQISRNYGIDTTSSAAVIAERLEHLWADMLGWMARRSFEEKDIVMAGNLWLVDGDKKVTIDGNLREVTELAFTEGMTGKAGIFGIIEDEGVLSTFKIDKSMMGIQSIKIPTSVSDDQGVDLLLTIAEIEKVEKFIESLAAEYINIGRCGESVRVIFEGQERIVGVPENGTVKDVLDELVRKLDTPQDASEFGLYGEGWFMTPDTPLIEIRGKLLTVEVLPEI